MEAKHDDLIPIELHAKNMPAFGALDLEFLAQLQQLVLAALRKALFPIEISCIAARIDSTKNPYFAQQEFTAKYNTTAAAIRYPAPVMQKMQQELEKAEYFVYFLTC